MSSIELSIDDLRRIVKDELELHPLCEEIDLFKLIYQAMSGPTHIYPDRDIIAGNIIKEVTLMSAPYLPLIQDIGNSKGFVRVSLFIIDSAFTTTEHIKPFCDAIMDSRLPEEPSSAEIYSLWHKSLDVISEFRTLDHTQLNIIEELIQDQAIPSHSDRYKNSYEPHYRLLHQSLLPKLREIEKRGKQ